MSFTQFPVDGIEKFGNSTGFPTTAEQGSYAVAEDTGILYTYFNGSWRAVLLPSGGADRQLSNLVAPTEINQDLLPVATATLNLGSATKAWLDVSTRQIDILGSTSGAVSILSTAVTTPYTLTLPAVQAVGTALLQNNGSGALSWTSATNLTDVGTDGIVITNGTGAVLGASPVTIAQHVADTSHNGYLNSTDWNTFNSKQAALTFGDFTDVGTDGITVTGGTGAVIGTGTSLSQHVADASHNGYLSSADWSTFNGKGVGTVTSVAMTVPSFLSVSGSPVTSTGTLAVTLSGTALPIANGGTGQTTKAPAFDALSPMSQGGDLIYGGASGTGTRLANGSAGQLLTSAGTTLAPTWSTINAALDTISNVQGSVLYRNVSTWTTLAPSTAGLFLQTNGAGSNVSWAAAGGVLPITSAQTNTYNVQTTDNVVQVDGTSTAFNVTLYTAVGHTGATVTIVRIDNTLANQISVVGTSAQTMRGQATFKVCTQYESVTFISDGANWQVMSHQTNSSWITGGTTTVTATGTTVTKPTMTTDTKEYRRVGDSMEVRFIMLSSGTSGTPGTGDYLFNPFPTGVTIDTSKAYVDTHTGGGAPDWPATVGSAACAFQGSSSASGTVRCYSTTQVRLYSFGGNLPVGPANGYGWGSNPMMYSCTFTVPITGWEG